MPAGGARSITALTGDGLVAQRGLAAVVHHCQTVFERLREPQPAAGGAGPVHPDADWAAAQQRLTELSGAPNNQPFAAQAEKWVETAGRALRRAEPRNAGPDPPTPATDGADRPAHTPPPAHTAPQDIDPAPPWVWSSLNLTARGATLQHGPFALRHGVGAYSVIIAGTGLAPVRLTAGTCVGVVSADAQRQWRPVPATELEAAEARESPAAPTAVAARPVEATHGGSTEHPPRRAPAYDFPKVPTPGDATAPPDFTAEMAARTHTMLDRAKDACLDENNISLKWLPGVSHALQFKDPNQRGLNEPRRTHSPPKTKVLQDEADKLLERRTVEYCRSEFCAPALAVRKPDGTGYRFVWDYRALNAVAKSLAAPIPTAEELFDGLGGQAAAGLGSLPKHTPLLGGHPHRVTDSATHQSGCLLASWSTASRDGKRADPAKLDAWRNFPCPTNTKDARRGHGS